MSHLEYRSVYLDQPIVRGRILDILEPEPGLPEQPVALFFVHGGGWRAGARADFHTIALAFRSLGFEVASTDYRLGGGVDLFGQIADVREALRFYADDLHRRGRSERVVLIGSSAGAHLALMVGLEEPPAARVAGVCVQAAPFTFEPWPDIFPAIWENMVSIIGTPYAADPEPYRRASPNRLVRPEMPPVFALHAQNEHMFPLELTEEFIRKAAACGARAEYKIYPNTEHGFFYSLSRRQQKEAFEDILAFIHSLEQQGWTQEA